MRIVSSFAVLGGALFLVPACASDPLPASRAAGVERMQCERGAVSSEDAALVQSATVLRVEPIYSHMLAGNNNSEERVSGAKILVRPPPGVSPEQLTRVLQCHGARALLGEADSAALPSDPYFMPDAWVAIEVKPDDGNFAIVLSADSVRENLRLLGRAQKYGGEHMMAVAHAIP